MGDQLTSHEDGDGGDERRKDARVGRGARVAHPVVGPLQPGDLEDVADLFVGQVFEEALHGAAVFVPNDARDGLTCGKMKKILKLRNGTVPQDRRCFALFFFVCEKCAPREP